MYLYLIGKLLFTVVGVAAPAAAVAAAAIDQDFLACLWTCDCHSDALIFM